MLNEKNSNKNMLEIRTVVVISDGPQFTKGYARFTTEPFKPLPNQ